MYTVERKKDLIDTLCLKDGEKELKIEVKLNLTKTLTTFEKSFRKLQLVQIEIQKGSTDFKKMGDAILDVFEIVFGKEDSTKMINFYDGDYTTLLIDVFPFILNVVFPAFEKAKKQRQKEIKQRVNRL